jgi:hypothetical protein
MGLCIDAMHEAAHVLGAALLFVATALLFEELTLGGLVRLILAPPPRRAKQLEPNRNKAKRKGESQCSH